MIMPSQEIRPVSALAIAGVLVCALTANVPAQEEAPIDSAVTRLLPILKAASADLASHRAALAAAEARSRAAGARSPATLSGEIEGIPDGVDVTAAQQIRIGIETELFTGPRRTAERAVTAAELDAASARLRLAESALGALARRSVTRWIGWTRIAERLAEEDALLASAEASLRTRLAAADARYVDVLRLRTERLRVQSERATALSAAIQGRRTLERLVPAEDSLAPTYRAVLDSVGRTPTGREGPPPLPPPPDPDSILAVSGALALAEADIGRARALRRQTLAGRRTQVVGFLGAQRFPASDGGFTVGPSIGAAISLPFTAAGSTRLLAAAAERDLDAAVAQQRAALARLRTGLTLARDRYEAARLRLAAFDQALLTGAREEREGALAEFRSGQLSLLELLDFERALGRAATERMRAYLDGTDALADLYAVVSPLDPDSSTPDTGATHDQ
jgi:cobalt-zinc-cadmium efflux system outer membrane protein